MKSLRPFLLRPFLLLPLLPLAFGTVPAAAQGFDRPPAGMSDDEPDYPAARAPVDQADAGGLAIRMSKLENRLREMTGQIEELQNANRKLVEQLQKFQADIDSRMAAGRAVPQKRTEVEKPKVVGENSPVPDTDGSTMSLRKAKHDDSFDPDNAPAGTPGKPKALGSTASAQADDTAGAPMDLSGGKLGRGANAADDTPAPTLRLPSATPKQQGGTVTPGGSVVASTGPTGAAPNTPRAEFDAALGSYRDKKFEEAEKGFTAFIQKNPKNKLAADATYYLGESYAQRGRSREAAEQYLKISTDYAGSSRAPDAMLHLGMSLKALGAKEQACATFSEVGRKYPNAPAYVKSGAEREAKRAQC